MSRRRVLFVSHDASRTGAPLLLLDFITWLRRARQIDPTVVCLQDGPLVDGFAAVAPTRVMRPAGRRPSLHRVATGLAELGADASAHRLDRRLLHRAMAVAADPELVWLSAAPSLFALDGLSPASTVPVVAHVHELSGVLTEILAPADLGLRLRRCDRIVVGADPVAEAVVAAGADRNRVRRRDEFIPRPPDSPPRRTAVADLRAGLGIPAGAPVVGAVATASHRKGIDLFVLLARMLRDRPGPAGAAHLVWVGGGPEDIAFAEARADIDHAGLADRVHLVEGQADLEPWFALLDVLVLTSREDSFPLVCLHAGVRGVPVVAFDSGIGDLLRRAGDPASAIAALDPAALADRVAALLADPMLRAGSARRLGAEVRRRHLTDTGAPALWAVMKEAAEWT